MLAGSFLGNHDFERRFAQVDFQVIEDDLPGRWEDARRVVESSFVKIGNWIAGAKFVW